MDDLVLTDEGKAMCLKILDWIEVPVGNGETGWKAPVSLTGNAHYFTLEAAYALEMCGPGAYGYAGEEALAEMQSNKDRQDTMEKYKLVGVLLGIPPNY